MATTLNNAILSNEVYKAGGGDPQGWTVIRRSDDPTNTGTYNNSGFYAVAYKNDLTGEVVIAYRGTNEALDWVNNKQILSGTVPDQFSDALTFLNEVTSRVDPLVNPISLTGRFCNLICVTGHSPIHQRRTRYDQRSQHHERSTRPAAG